MGQSPWLWVKSESKYLRFYEVASNWPRGTGSQRYATAKIIFKRIAGSKVLDKYYNTYLRK
jgi:hypothetical protein